MLYFQIFNMKDMKNFLQKKVEALRLKYKYNEQINVTENGVHLKDKSLYMSMQRWHDHTHLELNDWVSCFERAKKNLELNGLQFKHDQEVILSMLSNKYRETALKKQLSISDTIPESFFAHVKLFFNEEVSKSYEEFEYDLTQKAHEAAFYSRFFLPVALFLTYKEMFASDDDESLFNDCFSLGAGSRGKDLIPEVHAYCCKCGGSNWDNKNRIIFNLQLENNFSRYGWFEYSDSESENEDQLAVANDVTKNHGYESRESDSSQKTKS